MTGWKVNEVLRNVKSKSISGDLYRFQKKKYFHATSELFHRNFSGTRNHFEGPARFCPADGSFGFYFSQSELVAKTEIVFYAMAENSENHIHELDEEMEWFAGSRWSTKEVLSYLREKNGAEYVFLKCHVPLLCGLADFTDWEVVRSFMEEGTLRVTKTRRYEVDYLLSVMTRERGGNELTDVLGLDALASGKTGVIFPSVRATMSDGELPAGCQMRQSLSTLLPVGPDREERYFSVSAETMELPFQASLQLRQDTNVVIFDDNQLLLAMESLSWSDESGATRCVENPLFARTSDEIQEARVRDRESAGIVGEAAALTGLMTRSEREDEFYCGVIRVSAIG